jgi:hypothetical protein
MGEAATKESGETEETSAERMRAEGSGTAV